MGRKIFLSYSHQNTEEATKLRAKLEECGYSVWIDQKIRGGDDWEDAIKDALRKVTDLVVLLSPQAADSEWVGQEVWAARHTNKKTHPVLIKAFDGRPYPLWAQDIQHYDFIGQPYEQAFKELCISLTPPHPVQELLDTRLEVYEKTKVFLSEEDLLQIKIASSELDISPDASEFIEKSEKYHRGKWVRFLTGTFLGGGLALFYTLLQGKDFGEVMLIYKLVAFLIGGAGGFLYMLGREALLRTAQNFGMRLLVSGGAFALALTLSAMIYGMIISPFKIESWIKFGIFGAGTGFLLGIGLEMFLMWLQKGDEKAQKTITS